MKILVLSLNFAPELTGIGKYSGDMVSWLSLRGHEVRVVTGSPYYPEWAIGPNYSGWRYSRERFGQHCGTAGGTAVTVYRCPLWVPASPSGSKRVLHLLSFALFSFPVMLTQAAWRPDIVWAVAPTFLAAPSAWIAARLCSARCWLHIQDFEVDAAFNLGLLKGSLFRRIVVSAEKVVLGSFDRVSTISWKMIERLNVKGVPGERCFYLPNWVDVGAIDPDVVRNPQPTNQAPSFREHLAIPESAVVALYSGNMGLKQGLDVIADAAQLLEPATESYCAAANGDSDADPDSSGIASVGRPYGGNIYFVFCGAGPARAELEASCIGLNRVRFLPLQPVERLAELLRMADIHLLPQRSDAADLVLPSKLSAMLASGRPVVCTANPGTELATLVANCGKVVPSGDPGAFAGAICELSKDPSLRHRLGRAGRRIAEREFARDVVLQRFVAALSELAGFAHAEKESSG